MSLTDAIRRFREIDEATSSWSVVSGNAVTTRNIPHFTTDGWPFYGLTGLRQIERERRGRIRRRRRLKCKGYDPKCRDKEWEVPAPAGGVALLRRSSIVSPSPS